MIKWSLLYVKMHHVSDSHTEVNVMPGTSVEIFPLEMKELHSIVGDVKLLHCKAIECLFEPRRCDLTQHGH